ncbi:hypothetical protein GDO86_006689 [Hymenochirus boettgeri]|uniref:Uncharacterized protein n=1 Tax=Hymenochirus boettgeri TaxID=247094 RepID=A0A8T2JBI2_9PIPI|nr:hypothetical protein GDO86_006689 [Hymenochirus boettgeri]
MSQQVPGDMSTPAKPLTSFFIHDILSDIGPMRREQCLDSPRSDQLLDSSHGEKEGNYSPSIITNCISEIHTSHSAENSHSLMEDETLDSDEADNKPLSGEEQKPMKHQQKRSRAAFSHSQVVELERKFSSQKYLSAPESLPRA